MKADEVDSIDAIITYVLPMQKFMEEVAAKYTNYEVNAVVSFIERNFDKHTKAERTEFGLRLLNGTQGVEIEVHRGDCPKFTVHENPAVGLVRLSSRG